MQGKQVASQKCFESHETAQFGLDGLEGELS